MFLLRTITKHSESFALVASYMRACELAIDFVGQHNPMDGCSSPRQQWKDTAGHNFRTWRSTSFGQRKAEVQLVEEIA